MVNLIGYNTTQNMVVASALQTCGDPILLCLLGNHLLVHMKEAAENGLNEGTSYRSQSISAIDFDRSPTTNESSKSLGRKQF